MPTLPLCFHVQYSPEIGRKILYETDIIQWVEQQISLIKEQRYSEVDWVNLLEEIEDLSKRERDKFLSSISLIIQQRTVGCITLR